MKEIPGFKGNFLLKASGFGTGASLGLVLLFAFYYDNLPFKKEWLSRIDLALAFCVLMLSIRFSIA